MLTPKGLRPCKTSWCKVDRGEGSGIGVGVGEGEAREKVKERARGKVVERAREKVVERAREKVMERARGKAVERAREKVVERRGRRWWRGKGAGGLSFPAESPPPPQPAGRGGKPLPSGPRSPARAAWSR